MKTKSLTRAEQDWLKKLKDVLDECPSDRLAAYTIGDPVLHIFDSRFQPQIDEIQTARGLDFCKAVDELNAGLGSVTTPFPIHATSG